MSSLSITNVINIAVSTPPAGLGDFQVNNLAIFTKEVPVNGAVTFQTPGVYLSPSDVAADFAANSETLAQAVAIFSQSPNILAGGGQLIIFPLAGGDTLAAVLASAQSVQFFAGALYAGYAPNDAELTAAAAALAPLRVKLFISQYQTAALTTGTGIFDIIHSADEDHARKLLYTKAGTALGARLMAAAYAGRAMSTAFDGAATTQTMHLKDLVGVIGDTGITQAILNRCETLGVDSYPIIAGLPKVFCFGADGFWDDVYNLDWLVFALETAGFNALAETATKVPQTEPGVAALRGAYIVVLQAGVRNGFIAPGAWNSPDTFGDLASFLANIEQLGWFIYSQPVNQQSQSDRALRKAPLIRIAAKYAGAIHSSEVIVSVNP